MLIPAIRGIYQNKKLKFWRPRIKALVNNPTFHRLNGILVFFLGLILALPLPIPMTNLLAASPILCLGLGLLEDDGVFILISYALALVCFSAFATLFFWGKSYLSTIL